MVGSFIWMHMSQLTLLASLPDLSPHGGAAPSTRGAPLQYLYRQRKMGNSLYRRCGGSVQVSSIHSPRKLYINRRFSSPLTSNIYFPAIPTLAVDFNKSVELINLTVTMYMVLQGICTLAITVIHCVPLISVQRR